jgi:hypothetical protein
MVIQKLKLLKNILNTFTVPHLQFHRISAVRIDPSGFSALAEVKLKNFPEGLIKVD